MFTPKCIISLEGVGDEASETGNLDEALAAYSTALFLGPSTPKGLFIKWASRMLLRNPTGEVLEAAIKVCVPSFSDLEYRYNNFYAQFNLPRIMIYHTTCDILEREDRVAEVTRFFRQMQS